MILKKTEEMDTGSDTIIQSNISIDLSKKSNRTRRPSNGEKKGEKSESSTTKPTPRQSHERRPRVATNPQRITSETFLKHREAPEKRTLEEMKKLVKKGEIPVRVFGL